MIEYYLMNFKRSKYIIFYNRCRRYTSINNCTKYNYFINYKINAYDNINNCFVDIETTLNEALEIYISVFSKNKILNFI